MSELLTAEDIATRFRVGRATVLRWGREGRIPAVKVGRTVRFRAEDIEALVGTSNPSLTSEIRKAHAR